MKIGFVGLGIMGSAIAKNLLKNNFDVVVWNRTIQKAENFAKTHKCEYLSSLKDLVMMCDVIITMLAHDHASQEVYFADDGLFHNSNANRVKVYIEMGTISPSHLEKLNQVALSLNKKVVDAPVSGSIDSATNAELMIMLGCDEKFYRDNLKSIFDAISKKVLVLDQLGRGCILKLIVNSIIHSLNQVVSEGIVLGEKLGIDIETTYKVIENSAAAAPMLHYRKKLYLDARNNPVSFALSLAKKDMQLFCELAQMNKAYTPQSQINFENLKRAELAGFGSRDMASIIDYLRDIGL